MQGDYMKKCLLSMLLFLLLPLLLMGCTVNIGRFTFNNFSVTKKKPNDFYYTNNLLKNLTLEKSLKITVLDTNFYKEEELSSEDIEIVKNFGKALSTKNFMQKPKDLPDKVAYKLFFTFNKEKYVINIYNEQYISVYPWDGTYPMDYIDMQGIQPLYNIYSLCKYIIDN